MELRSGPTSVLTPTIFTRRYSLASSPFLRPMHPKTAVQPRPEAMARILAAGWVAQLKIHGHRAQVHIPSDPDAALVVYNRQGHPHRKTLPDSMAAELRRLLTPKKGWNVVDAEWIKPEDRLYLFDFVKKDGVLLRALTFPERWKLLPRAYLSPHVRTLPVLHTLEECLEALASKAAHVEGLVFKSKETTGFSDTSIVRCRKA